jgi:superfamily II DNA or RNA helicase
MDIKVSENIILENASTSQKNLIKSHMSFLNPAWQEAVNFRRSTYGIRKIIRLYEEKNDYLILPRGSLYKIAYLVGEGGLGKIDFDLASFPRQDIPSKISLRPLQMPWVEGMLKHKQGIGVAPAGSGKTVMGLYMIAKIGQPTLWLTHRQTLVNQFIERANSFLSPGKVGMIGGGKFEVGDLLTVGMIQTLHRKQLLELSRKFGVVICDEVHIVPCQTALNVIKQFGPEYLYGLTATPYRDDGLEQIMFDAIGPELVRMQRDDAVELGGILPAKICVVKTGISIPQGYPYEWAKILDFLLINNQRNTMLINMILTEVGLGNTCVVLTSRVAHGKEIKNRLLNLGVDSEHIHAGIPRKKRSLSLDRFINNEVGVMIATYQMLAEGFDHAPTNRIFFALPQKAKRLIEQSKGRIERVLYGKNDAIVYDLVDNIPMMAHQFQTRLDHYQEQNLEIFYR